MTLTKTNRAVLDTLRKSRGRFVGLTTKSGNSMNAQFLGETNNYVIVFDRNQYSDRKIAKSSLSKVRCGNLQAG